MNRLELYKRISKIHAIKCNKANSEDVALASFNDASKLKNQLEHISDASDLEAIIESARSWTDSAPTVSEHEIQQLMKNGK